MHFANDLPSPACFDMSHLRYAERITVDEQGTAYVRNTGIAVLDVVGWLADGLSGDKILEQHPELAAGDIGSCLAYVADRLSND